MKILKGLWYVFESACFAVGLFIFITVLTVVINGSSLSIKKNGEQMFCYSTETKQCTNLSEETKHEKD